VLAKGPYGAMTAARRTHRDVLLIAGGVGITPLRPLFETLPLQAGQDLLLLYRARTEADLLFREELNGIAASRGARVQYRDYANDGASPLESDRRVRGMVGALQLHRHGRDAGCCHRGSVEWRASSCRRVHRICERRGWAH
jgi:ferredoxin-NADP reductase